MINLYYIAINLITNEAIITKSKRDISSHLGISVSTIDRRLSNTSVYVCKEYIITGKIEPIKQRKGNTSSLSVYRDLLKDAMRHVSSQIEYQKSR